MPMQWTLANERLLFLRVLDSHKGAIDYKWIASTWPNPDEKPTPRAVSEHIFKLRKLAKVDAENETAPSTPKTPRAKSTTPRASRGSRSTNSKDGKRKRDAAAETSSGNFTPVNVKQEEKYDISAVDLGALQNTPTKRVRKSVDHLNMKSYAESSDDEEHQRFSSADPEFTLDEPEETEKGDGFNFSDALNEA